MPHIAKREEAEGGHAFEARHATRPSSLDLSLGRALARTLAATPFLGPRGLSKGGKMKSEDFLHSTIHGLEVSEIQRILPRVANENQVNEERDVPRGKFPRGHPERANVVATRGTTAALR